MTLYALNSCERCTGDLHSAEDKYGIYWVCLQCGYTMDVAIPTVSGVRMVGVVRQ